MSIGKERVLSAGLPVQIQKPQIATERPLSKEEDERYLGTPLEHFRDYMFRIMLFYAL
jgi:hypothetical protein